MDPDETPWWKRRGPLMGMAALVVVALVLGGAMLVRHNADRDRLAVGASRPGDYSMGGGYFSGTYRFEVPGARITVNLEAGDHASKLDDSSSRSTVLKAPQDGLLVHLDWSAITSGGAELKYVGAQKDTSSEAAVFYTGGHPTKLSLRSKGDPVVVDPALVPSTGRSSSDGDNDSDSDGKVVAVRGGLSSLELVATFRGRTQSVSLVSGRRVMADFASLYSGSNVASRPVSIADDRPADVGRTLRSDCDVLTGRMTRTPYLDGLGWAAPGRQWILVDGAGYRTSEDTARWSDGDHSAYYTATKAPRTAVTVNGRKPVRALGEPTSDTNYDLTTVTRDYVFSVPAGGPVTVDVTARFALQRNADGDAQAPARQTLQLHTTDIYPAVIDPTVRERR